MALEVVGLSHVRLYFEVTLTLRMLAKSLNRALVEPY
jgi:hypothetical protein